LRFFFDNCISPYLVKGLRGLAELQKFEFEHLRDRFAPDTVDAKWLADLAKDGDWIVISADPRISRGAHERAAWREANLTTFFFASGWTERRYWAQASELVRWWPKIYERAREEKRGAAFLLHWKGKEIRQLL
jgi:hypothetical protein